MRAVLKFDKRRVTKPVISTAAIEFDTPINILRADVDEKGGKVLVEIADGRAQQVLEAIKREGVEVEHKTLITITHRCIDCGHCITLCPVEAIRQDHDLKVRVEESKCIQCERCVDACPLRAIVLTK
ncbi:MAG: 4Fe-4S binding protein [Candidatus Bathyarchaeia archaeon]